MTDIVDKKTRSRMMSGIRSRNTKPEILIRKALHRIGYRFRLNSKVGKIKPDIVLRCHKVAIFTHGCYWHQHKDCKLAYSDRKYSDKWEKKFEDNRKRDQRVLEKLTTDGYRVAVIWECATRNSLEFKKILGRLDKFIKSKVPPYLESNYRVIL